MQEIVMKSFSNLGKWWGAIMIPCGLVLAFYGFKMILFTFALLIFMAVSAVLFLFLTLMLFAATLTVPKIAIFAIISLASGIAASYYGTKRATKYGIALLAAAGMMSLSFMIVPLLGMNDLPSANKIKLVIYIIFACLGFFGAAKLSDGIQVFVTAFIGSYMFIRGISMFAGGFINEFDMTNVDGGTGKPKDIKIEPIFYGYLVAIATTFVLGVIV